MLGLSGKLLFWNLSRNRGRTLIMIVTVFCALSSYVLLGTALSQMAEDVVGASRPGWPFDVTVEGVVTAEDLNRVKGMNGVTYVEAIRSSNVFLGPGLQEVVSINTSETTFNLEMSSGRLPDKPDEIAIPERLSDAFSMGVGEELRVVGQREGSTPQEYTIVGILSGNGGVLPLPLLTEDGMGRIRDGENVLNRMLIQLDGNVNINTFSRSLAGLVNSTSIALETEGYSAVKQNRSLSDSLVGMLRLLILMITAASLGVLLYLSQRSGAYQIGVLRAIGVQRIWIMLPAIAVTLLVFTMGYILTALLLPTVAVAIGLHTDPVLLIRTLTRDVVLYVLIGLLCTLMMNWEFVNKPVPSLLRDSW